MHTGPPSLKHSAPAPDRKRPSSPAPAAGCSLSINITNQTQADISFQFGEDWATFSRLNDGLNSTAPLEPGTELCVQGAELPSEFTCAPEPGQCLCWLAGLPPTLAGARRHLLA